MKDSTFREAAVLSWRRPLLALTLGVGLVPPVLAQTPNQEGLYGAADIVSPRGTDPSALAAEARTANGRQTRAAFGTRFDNGLEVAVSASHVASDIHDRPPRELVRAGEVATKGADYENSTKLQGKAGVGPFRLTALHSERNKGLLPAPWASVFDKAPTASLDKSTLLDLVHTTQFRQFAITTRVFHGDYVFHGASADTTDVSRHGATGQWSRTEVEAAGAVAPRHNLLLGADYQRSARYAQGASETDPAWAASDGQQSQAVGLYAQHEYALRPTVMLTGGVRYDAGGAHSVGSVSPRLAIVHKPNGDTTGKLLYTHAVRNPDTYDSFNAFTAVQIGNADLRPERIRSLKASLERRAARGFKLSASLFANHIDGLVQPFTEPVSGLLQLRNQPEFDTRGSTVALERQFRTGAKLRGSYTLQNVDAPVGLAAAPRNVAKLDWSGPLLNERVKAGVETQYTSSRVTGYGEVGGFAVANLLFQYRLHDRVELSASLFNVLNKRYTDATAFDPAVPVLDIYQQAGRIVRLKALLWL